MLWMASQWARDAMITSLWRRLTSYWRYHWVMCPLGWWWYLDDQWFRVEWNVLCCCSDNILYPCYQLKLFKYPFACHFRGSGYVMQPSSILLKAFCQLCAKRWWLLHVIEANQILMNVDIQVINKLMPTLIRMIMFITFVRYHQSCLFYVNLRFRDVALGVGRSAEEPVSVVDILPVQYMTTGTTWPRHEIDSLSYRVALNFDRHLGGKLLPRFGQL